MDSYIYYMFTVQYCIYSDPVFRKLKVCLEKKSKKRKFMYFNSGEKYDNIVFIQKKKKFYQKRLLNTFF